MKAMKSDGPEKPQITQMPPIPELPSLLSDRLALTIDHALRLTNQQLSPRVLNALAQARISTLGDLVVKTDEELLAIPNFGRSSLFQVRDFLIGMGFNLGRSFPTKAEADGRDSASSAVDSVSAESAVSLSTPHSALPTPAASALIHLADCVTGMAELLPPDSIDLTVTSIPFGALFSYSGKTEDVGNNADGTDMRASGFGLHMRFFIAQLLRVMKPGCNVCIHIQQLLRYKNQHGYMGRRDFRGALVDMMESGGFEWKGEFVIPKNPQVIAQRLNLHCLMFETARTNGRNLAPAVNDYVMIFQRPGESVAVPCLYDITKNPAGWVSKEDWIRDAHGVWTNIRETDVLEGWKGARDEKDEKHVCPLQLEVIRRLIRLYSNAGEVVLDPFMGIGSTAWVAIEQKRHAVGFELKPSYHALAVRNAARAVEKFSVDQEDLFTLAEKQGKQKPQIAQMPQDSEDEDAGAGQ